MASINGKEITRELLEQAMQCDTPEELMKLAKEHGAEITKEQAEAYLSEFEDIDLDSEQLKKAAGGVGDVDYEKKPGFEQCRGYNSPFPHKM